MLHTTLISLPTAVLPVLQGYAEQGERAASRRAWRRGRTARALAEQGAAARRTLEQGSCESVHATHDAPPAVVTHEHGLLVLIPLQDGSTHLLDVSSVSDDIRWDLHVKGELLRTEWQWLRLDGIGGFGFTAHGPAIEAVDLGDLHASQLERELTERDDGWPGDDVTLSLAFDHAVRLARLPLT